MTLLAGLPARSTIRGGALGLLKSKSRTAAVFTRPTLMPSESTSFAETVSWKVSDCVPLPETYCASRIAKPTSIGSVTVLCPPAIFTGSLKLTLKLS